MPNESSLTTALQQARASQNAHGFALMGCRPQQGTPAELSVDPMIDTPYEDSSEGKCTSCGRAIWIGPTQRKMVEAATDVTWHLLCLTCAALAMSGLGKGEYEVHSLGNNEFGRG